MIRLTASFLVLAWGVPAQAAETTPVNALNKVESTRAQAFGGAATALGNDPTLVWVNPAAPAQVAGSSLTLAAQRGYFSDMTGQGVFTTPLKPGVLTAGLLYYDAGAGTGVYQTDGAEWKQPLQQDILGAAGFAMPIAPRVTAGGLLKAMHTQLGDDAKAWGAVLDAGVHIRVQDMFKLGFAVSNLGTRVRYLGDPVAPLAAVRAGAAVGWRFRDPEADASVPSDSVILLLDAEYHLVDHDAVWHGGAEYTWHGWLSARAGVRLSTLREPSSFAAGAGFKFSGFRLDYSVRYSQEFDVPQTLSVTFAIPSRLRPGPTAAGASAALTAPPAAGTPAVSDAATADAAALDAAGKGAVERKIAPPPDQPAGNRDLIDDLNRQLDGLMEKKAKP